MLPPGWGRCLSSKSQHPHGLATCEAAPIL